MIIGYYKKANAEPLEAAADTWVGVGGTGTKMPDADAYITKISALLDGMGSGSGTQKLRAGIWAGGGALIAATEEVEIPNNAELAWYDFPFTEPVTAWGLNVLRFPGLHFGGPDNIVRWYGDPAKGGYLIPTGPYEEGDENLEVGSLENGPRPLIITTYSVPVELPNEEDAWYARLGFDSAQAKLGETGPQEGTRQRVKVGWHGTWLDAEPQGASFAIVDRSGPLAELVGERIKVSYGKRSVYAYVHRSTDLEDGEVAISLTRRLFAALAPLSAESLSVKVEVLI